MILDHKGLCKEVSKENDIDEELLLSVNNLIYKEIYDWTKQPTHLKIYLKHIGSWYFKKMKTAKKLKMFQDVLAYNTRLYESNRGRVINYINNYTFILSEYDKYLKEKYELKCLKYGKEAYEAYCLAKRQEKIQKSQKNKPL